MNYPEETLLISPFKLERYYALYEFSARTMLSSSDCESMSIQELLENTDRETRSLWDNLRLGYTETRGHPVLQAEIAALYPGLSTENVVVLAPQEGIFIAIQSLLQPTDHVISVFPAYQSLYEIARSIGCEVTNWNLQPRYGKWNLDLDSLENCIQSNTRLLVINFPHNPTGYLPSIGDLEKIAALADRHGLYLFSDEMYRFLELGPVNRLPSICEIYPKGITLAGMSKAFGLPGLRIGWLVTPDRHLVDHWLAMKDYTTICNSAPSEILALAALRKKETFIARNLNIIHNNLSVAGQFFEKYPADFEWIPPIAGSVAFPRLRRKTAIDVFCQDLLQKKSVMLVHGGLFDFPGNYFRLGLGRLNFKSALQLLEEFILGL
jgi:aspartate/methionine/tyrosine aminotransferase